MSTTMRRMRRVVLAGALAMVTVPLVTSSAAQAATCPNPDTSCVIVRVVSTSNHVETVIEENAIDLTTGADLHGAPLGYKVRSTPNTTPVPLEDDVTDARSLHSLFGSGSTFSEAPNAKNVPSVLDKDHYSSGYADGLVPAVYARPDGGVGYVRPLTADAADVNADDVFVTAPKTPLIITLHKTGDLLDVAVKATPTKITTETPVTFSATVAPNSDALRYEWNFTGGTKAEDKSASPTHTYTKKGTYAVNLQVRDADGSYGRAATTSVKVGSAPKPPKATTGTGGSGGSGGGGGGGGGTGGGGSGGTGGGGGGYTPPYIPNDTSTPPLGEGPPTTESQPPAPVDDGLQEVEGFVLAGAGAETGDSIPGAEVASQPTKASELSTSRKISGAVIGALAVILLLGLGAEIETRWVSTRLTELRRGV